VTAGRRPRWPGADLPGRRLFIAVPLPADATAAIADLVGSVRAAGVPGGGRDVRWVSLDGLHLTLHFLGPTLDDRVAPATEAVRAAAAASAPFDVSIGGAGAFPSASRPRALWLGIRSGAAELVELAGIVDATLMTAGWTFEPRPLSPHLTLARSDGVPAGAAIGERLVAAAAGMDVVFRADRIGLFESLTGGGPARYEPLEVVALG
jgi:2'-5' RNA ligase